MLDPSNYIDNILDENNLNYKRRKASNNKSAKKYRTLKNVNKTQSTTTQESDCSINEDELIPVPFFDGILFYLFSLLSEHYYLFLIVLNT